ncbi:MAG: carboxypeptidase regulatory-like domain-containing protein [Ignavibacteria bacterium]|nr:carboxypeptidase regulatory-like domain-containing protein [Ignavibacteria bacterium]
MAQRSVTVSGTVRDTRSQPIVRATIQLLGTQRGAYTDARGWFRLDVPRGRYSSPRHHVCWLRAATAHVRCQGLRAGVLHCHGGVVRALTGHRCDEFPSRRAGSRNANNRHAGNNGPTLHRSGSTVHS